MKKISILMIAFIMIISLFAGCNSNSSNSGTPSSTASIDSGTQTDTSVSNTSEPTQITWLAYGAGENDWEGQTRSIFEKYYQDNNVRVNGEFYAFNDYFEVVEVKIASGSAEYDLISVDAPMVAAYVTRDYIAPMDSYFTEEEKALIIPSAIDAGSYQGVFYSPPVCSSSMALFYNTDLLNQAGVTIRENSVENRLTWEEVEKMAKDTLDVIDPDRNLGYAGIMFWQVSRTYQMNSLPNSFGEKSIGDDGFTVDGVINSDGWIKALNWYQNLHNNNISLRGITANETADYFNSGKAVFFVGGTITPVQAPDVNCGFVPYPTFEGYDKNVATPTGSWHLGINKASKKYDDAAAFIKYMTIGEGNDMFIAASNDLPSKKPTIDKIIGDPNSDPLMKIVAYEAANTAVPRALTPAFSEYSSIIDATFEDIRNGMDVKSALDTAVNQMNTAFEKYKS